MNFRIGQGFDVHAFCPGNEIILGGTRIPCGHGILAHSDGDVLIHALCDALLGAISLGDIGEHFPDTDAQYKGISSMQLLSHVHRLILDQGWTVVNTDMTIICQTPKISPYKNEMRANIATMINIDISQVSIKATTTEHLGFTGRKEGLAVLASVLICKDIK